MEWVDHREDVAETLLNQLHRPSSIHPQPDFSPLVTNILTAPNAASAVEECHIATPSRHTRNDFRFHYSLAAGPEFDTDSADPPLHPEPHEGDDTSTELQGAATSEDTSFGADASVPSTRIHEMPTRVPSISVGPLASANHHSTTHPTVIEKKEAFVEGNSFLKPDDGTVQSPLNKPSKTIVKKRSNSKKQSPVMNASASVSGGTSTANGAPSHTKMCRDRLNNMFERLRHTLPPAPSGVEVKHKAQVLDYAIAVLKTMVDTTRHLETELAVSSNKATMEWISKLVDKVDTFEDAACEVMHLFSRRRGWKHAELWIAGKPPYKHEGSNEHGTVLTFSRAVVNETMGTGQASLEGFSTESEGWEFYPKEGVQGRVWSSMRPEWVTGLWELKNFRRASLAKKHGLKVCLAVPVTVTGKIEAVVCFYDTKHRPYDTQCLELGMRLAWALGNAIGGKRAKVNALETSDAPRI